MSENIEATPKRGRGRPVGAIREVYFILTSIIAGNIAQEKIAATRGEAISPDIMKLEVIEKYKRIHNITPEIVLGPFFDAALTQVSSSTKKESSPRFSEELINLT